MFTFKINDSCDRLQLIDDPELNKQKMDGWINGWMN